MSFSLDYGKNKNVLQTVFPVREKRKVIFVCRCERTINSTQIFSISAQFLKTSIRYKKVNCDRSIFQKLQSRQTDR